MNAPYVKIHMKKILGIGSQPVQVKWNWAISMHWLLPHLEYWNTGILPHLTGWNIPLFTSDTCIYTNIQIYLYFFYFIFLVTASLVDRPTQLICISDIYLYLYIYLLFVLC